MSVPKKNINKSFKGTFSVVPKAGQDKARKMYQTYVKDYNMMKAKVEAVTSEDTYIPKMKSFTEYIHYEIPAQKAIYAEKGIKSTNYGRDITRRQFTSELISREQHLDLLRGNTIDRRGYNYAKQMYKTQQNIIKEYMTVDGLSKNKAIEKYKSKYDVWLTQRDYEYRTDAYYTFMYNYLHNKENYSMPVLDPGS